ncbi:MAG: protein kinase [Paludibacter sp.]
MTTNMLQKTDKLLSTEGKKLKVLEYIGSGGQGEVYRVEYSGNKDFALKWYFPQNATNEQLEMLKISVKTGSPDQRFLWPQAIVRSNENPDLFGYVMPFRPKQFRSATEMLSRKIEPSFQSLMTACYQLADSFLQLHSKGLSYRDISINNVFIDPDKGDILICDNDNVSYEGSSYTGVAGTPKYMAPEIVRNESQPNKYTDLYSLSVLLFFMCYIAHPLDGKREAAIHAFDELAQKKLYGINPLYIFHPTDKSNEPDPEFHSNALAFAQVFPKVLRDEFERAFTIGLFEPAKRVEESVWRKLFVKLRDNIIICQECGVEIFYDISKVKQNEPLACWCCNKNAATPPRMRLNNEIIILSKSIKLFPHHTNGILYDFTKPTAEISEHPILKILGLKNLSEDIWYVTKPDNSIVQIQPGRSFALENGFSVKFELLKAEIKT